MDIFLSFSTHLYVIQNLCDFLSSLEHMAKYGMLKNLSVFMGKNDSIYISIYGYKQFFNILQNIF